MADNTIEEQVMTPPKLWNPFIAVIVTVAMFFTAQVIAAIVVAIYPLAKGFSGPETSSWLETNVIGQFAAGLVYYSLIIFWVIRLFKRLGFNLSDLGLVKPKVINIVQAFAGYAVYFLALIAGTLVIQNIFTSLDFDQKQELSFSPSTTGPALVFVFVGLVLLPAIAEEILCRGFLYNGLRTKLKPIISTIIVSVLFAAAHLQWGSSAPLLWAAALDTFVLSLVLCFLREKTGSLWPPIILHALKNGVAFFVLFVQPLLT